MDGSLLLTLLKAFAIGFAIGVSGALIVVLLIEAIGWLGRWCKQRGGQKREDQAQ